MNINELIKHIKAKYPRGFNSCFTKEDKFNLASLLFSIGGVLSGSISPLISPLLSTIGIACAAGVLKNFKELAFRFNNHEYYKLLESVDKTIERFKN